MQRLDDRLERVRESTLAHGRRAERAAGVAQIVEPRGEAVVAERVAAWADGARVAEDLWQKVSASGWHGDTLTRSIDAIGITSRHVGQSRCCSMPVDAGSGALGSCILSRILSVSICNCAASTSIHLSPMRDKTPTGGEASCTIVPPPLLSIFTDFH